MQWNCGAMGNCGLHCLRSGIVTKVRKQQRVFTGTKAQRQKWIFTDVVPGPWSAESKEAPLSGLQLSSIDVVVEKDQFVNVFRLADILEKHDGIDLVLSFGSWPNVLTDEICESVEQSSPLPGHRRVMIQRLQKQVWNFPDEFLVSFSAAVMAQMDGWMDG